MSDLHRFCFPFEHRLFLDRWEVNFLQPSKSCSNFGLSVRNLASCLRSSSQVHCTVQLFCPLQPTTTFSNKFTKNNQGGLQADSVKLHHYWYSSCPPYKKYHSKASHNPLRHHDTVVRDPFYHDVPAFFRMSFDDLIECKHPTAWIEFEKGITDEVELARIFFKDGRHLDLEGLKNCMRKRYYYVEGVEDLLNVLKHNNYEMHAFTNYPIWYEMIKDKLNISKYLSWTFCSCINRKRKPDPEFYLEVVSHLKVDPGSCIFVDDRIRNVEAVKEVGMIGLHFKNADSLRQDLTDGD